MASISYDDDSFDDSVILEYITPAAKKVRTTANHFQTPDLLQSGGEAEAEVLAAETPNSSQLPTPLDEISDSDVQRRAYLLTYVYVNVEKFPTRESFSSSVLRAFHGGKSKNDSLVTEWCCSEEPHEVSGRFHYHMAVHLSKPRRWIEIKQRLHQETGAVVNFSAEGLGYAWAVRYAVKCDDSPMFSNNHKDYSKINGTQSISAFTSHSRKSAQKRKSRDEAASSSFDSQPGDSQPGDVQPPRTKSGGKGLGSKRVQVFPAMGRLLFFLQLIHLLVFWIVFL